jgi:hypothetical protein
MQKMQKQKICFLRLADVPKCLLVDWLCVVLVMAIVEWRPSKEGQLQWMRTMQRMLSLDAVEGDADKEECRWVRVIDAGEAIQHCQRRKKCQWSLRVRRGGSFIYFHLCCLCEGCYVQAGVGARASERGGGGAGAVIHHLPYL